MLIGQHWENKDKWIPGDAEESVYIASGFQSCKENLSK